MMNRNSLMIMGLLFQVSLLFGAMPPDTNRMQDGFAPTPFSAEVIKEFCKPGHETRFLFESPGQKSVVQITTFLESTDSEKARIASRRETTEGELLEDEETVDIDWKQLQAHSSFSEEFTKISEESITLAEKEYDCWKYVVEMNVSSNPFESTLVTMTLWFAKELPGPPVKMTQEAGGEQRVKMTWIPQPKTSCEEKACCAEKTDTSEGQ